MLEEKQIEDNFNKYIDLIKTNVKREGVENLINYLINSDLKIAPASTKYHNSFKGGLVAHCLDVYNRLNQLVKMEYPTFVIEGHEMKEVDDYVCPISQESIVIVALLHDISKVNFYEILERNTKDAQGNWVKVPYYQVKDEAHRFIMGSHSMNSLYMVSKLIKLKYDEELAILHHMGGIDVTEDTISAKNTLEAYKKSKLALFTHFADMLATAVDEA